MQNFLSENQIPQHPQLSADSFAKRWHTKRMLLIVCLLCVVAIGGMCLVGASRLIGAMSRVKDTAGKAQDALRSGDFVLADAQLVAAQEAIGEAKSGIKLLVFMRPLPWIGTQIKGLSYTFDAAEKTLDVLHEALGIVTNVASVTHDAERLVGIEDSDVPYQELSPSARVAMLEELHRAYPELLAMQVKLAIAKDDLDRLQNLDVVAPLDNAIAPFAAALDPLMSAVNLLTPFAATVPDLAGLGEDKQLLLLFTNNTELRPGGGFLGVYGLAIVRDGALVALTTDDTYHLDNRTPPDYAVTPPAPLATYLGSKKWYFRDANWSPDFPSSTKDTVTLMRQEYAAAGEPVPDVHGVLMFTPTFIGDLLRLIGPVTVDDQTFTADNVADTLEYQVEQGYALQGIPPEQRKEIVSRLTGTVVDRLLSLPTSSWPEIFTVLSNGFSQKQFALWSPDAATEQVYTDAGWAGKIFSGTANDVLMVVDANMGALKTDPYVERTIAYSVRPDREGYVATTAITYHNTATYTWKTTRYRTYTRIYVPEGSTLLSASGAESAITVGNELGLTTFGALTTVVPGATQTLTFTYRIAPSVVDALQGHSYELAVFKQLGAAHHQLSLHIDVPSPVVYAIPSEEAAFWHDNAYDFTTTLDTDKTFFIEFDR